MAVDYLRPPNMLREFNGGAAKFAEALGIVVVIAAFFAVELSAIEIVRIVHEIKTNAADRSTFDDGRKAQLVTERNREARNGAGLRFGAAISRQEDGNLMPGFHQRGAEAADNIGEAARFRVRDAFGSHKKNFHCARTGRRSYRRDASSSRRTLRLEYGGIAKLDGTMARQKLGQHFLSDLSWRRRILQTLGVAAGESWLEIGAGHGEMTELLARAGARVVAIETDEPLVNGLRERAAGWGDVEVVSGDVLQVDLRKLAGEGVRIYGNLPYYITSPILRHLFALADRVRSIHIVIQFEVAERIVARPGRRAYGYLSALCQFYAKPEIAMRIPPGAFRPPPEVTSALVEMTLPGERAGLGIEDETRFLDFVQTCFGQKRKTLRNNLRRMADAPRIETAFAKCGLASTARAEEMTLAQFAAMFKAVVM